MARQLLGVTVLSLVLAACSSTPIDSSTEQGSTEEAAGNVSLPLTTQVGTTTYRLRAASFVISGPTLATARTVKPLDDAQFHVEKLPVGSYSILLKAGWVLEKRGAAEKAFTAVKAELVTDNPLSVEVDGKTVADAFFGFVTTSGDVSLGDGSARIHIGVQDCSSYDSYMAALAELTVQCLGTLDPNSYGLTQDGWLAPRFQECKFADLKGQNRMRSIKQLLSLQQRTARLPFAKACMAGRYDAAVQKLAAAGVSVCPTWKFSAVVNPVTNENIEGIIKELPVIPEDGLKDDGSTPKVLEKLKQNSIYKVSLPPDAPKQSCESAGACALACASPFPGFALRSDGEEVLTDPPAWLLDTVYLGGPPSADPYLRAGYYHPMSWYPAPPGQAFGDYARFEPCGPANADGMTVCNPELCTYYSGGLHKATKLQMDCAIPGNIDTCNSYCGPLIIK